MTVTINYHIYQPKIGPLIKNESHEIVLTLNILWSKLPSDFSKYIYIGFI